MKNKLFSFLLSGILFLLMSCAEAGPYETGKLECDISTLSVLPTSALLKVNIPQNKDNVIYKYDASSDYCDVYLLSESYIKSSLSVEERMEHAIRGIGVDDDYYTTDSNIFFGGLYSDTKYYVVLDVGVFFNRDREKDLEYWRIHDCYYFTDFSFTTPKDSFTVETESITPFTANLKVSFQLDESQHLESRKVQLFLSDEPFDTLSDDFYSNVFDKDKKYIWSYERDYDYKFDISGLNPDTQYYIGVLVSRRYKYDLWQYAYCEDVYVTDQSFTTPNVSD